MTRDTTAADDAEHWSEQARGAIDEVVHGKDVAEVVAIPGEAVVVLGDGWSDTDARALRDALYDRDFPPMVLRGSEQVRTRADDSRLSVRY